MAGTSETQYNNIAAYAKTITISSVNLSKAILLIHQTDKNVQAPYGNSYYYLSSATVITYWPYGSTYSTVNYGTTYYWGGFSWQVVEFY